MEAHLALLVWSHACTVGVKAMDDQHGILLDTLNELRLALGRDSGHEQINARLRRIVQLTRMHFQSEEQLLEQHCFPGLPEHRAAHQRLLSEISQTVDIAERSANVEMIRLTSFLGPWYLEHIQGLDRQYGAWLNARGVF